MKEQARQRIGALVDRFRTNIDVYKRSAYKEAQVRREFIDPFFEALGWDVSNKQGFAEQYKEVVLEDTIKVGRSTRAPDYSFRIGSQRKFFVEAKKPAINIKEDVSPSYQLRRYAWSAKLPLSIVTDFEEFSVFNCQMKPNQNDKVGIGRIGYYTYDEYIDKFDDIYDVFSKEAVLKGSFDRYAQSTKGKKGTAAVDSEFLKEIESWREMLAKNIALRNTDVSIYELNYAVQKIIDRIIFLRICEDRGIEPYGQLQTQAEAGDVYMHLLNHFKLAESKYNSGIFDFECDGITPALTIDDKVLKMIIQSLYYPKSPYEFSVLGVEILGNVYEQFLGKVIRLTAGHQAKVETKPEVKKAGGVYYTPQYIVEYIVENTVGKLTASKTPEEIAGIKILDPACGSGSFLIGAYTYLLRYHRDWYVSNKPKKHKGKMFQAKENEWYLTTAEKKRILLDNIFGVDIDSQAVEVTKMSLLLKVLEHESRESIDQQAKLGLAGVLPNLEGNIKCGNSLIGSDILEANPKVTEEEIDKINPFDWEREFSEIMARGGFDAVIGNPPYGAEFPDATNKYLKNKFYTFVWRGESYLCFVENAVKSLKLGGKIGYIIPDTYLNLGFTQSLRTFLLKNTKIESVVLLPSNVFNGATVDTTLLFAEHLIETEIFHKVEALVKTFNKKTNDIKIDNPDREFLISTKFWYKQNAFNVFSNEFEIKLISKIDETHRNLSQSIDLFYGIKAYQMGKGKPPQTKEIRDSKPFTSERQIDETFLPFFDGKHIGRYELLWKENNWIKYGPWLAEPRTPDKFKGEKILIRKIVGKTLIATYSPTTSYCNTLLYVLKINDECEFDCKYLLGILNSKFVGWYFRKRFQISDQDTFPQILIRDILQIPVPVVNNAHHDQMVSLVERMLDLHKRLLETKTGHQKTLIQRQIDATDRQIDGLVYDLYGLTEEEVKVMKGAF